MTLQHRLRHAAVSLPLVVVLLLSRLAVASSPAGAGADAAATCPYDIAYAARLIPPECYANSTSTTTTSCCWFVFASYIYAATRHANRTGTAFLPDPAASACSSAFSAHLLRRGLVPPSLLLTGDRCNLAGDPVKFAAGTRPCQFSTISAVRSTADLSNSTRLCADSTRDFTSDEPACVACQNAVISSTFDLLNATNSKEFVACGMAVTMGIWSPSMPEIRRFRSYALCMLQILENVGNLGTSDLLPSSPPPPPTAAESFTSSRRSSRSAKIVAAMVSSAGILFLIAAAFLVLAAIRRKRSLAAVTTTASIATPPLPREGLYIFTKSELKLATNNFDGRLLLGEGGAGKVYLGKLPSGQHVAIKRIHKRKEKKKEKLAEFYREVEILGKLRHGHLTALLGYCLHSGHRREHLLVYEYMPGGNLSRALHHGELTWRQRLRIAADVADGLAYLHGFPEGAVVHRDVKPTNVLLGSDGRAKLSDFGVSKTVPLDALQVSTEVKGTPGYVDPEYFSAGQVSLAADVYSFGVVLLELVTGLRAVVPTPSGGAESLVNATHGMMTSPAGGGQSGMPELGGIVDSRLGEGWDRGSVTEVFRLANRCVRPFKSERPQMEEVLGVLRRVLTTVEAVESGSEPSLAGEVHSNECLASSPSMAPTPSVHCWSI